MSEPAIDLSQDVESRMLTMNEQADALVIDSESTYRAASGFLLNVKDLTREIISFFEPLKRSASDAHKKLCAAEKEKVSPLLDVERKVKTRMLEYEAAERRRKAEQEAKLREEARKIEEESRLREATRLEAEGRTREAERLIDAPIFTPPVTVAPPTPRVQGVKYVTTWKFRIIDESLIPRQFLAVDEKKIGAVVRAMRGEARVPGVEVYEDRTIAAGAR